MFRKILAATAALTLGLGGVIALAAPASAGNGNGNGEGHTPVNVCHANSSDYNEGTGPYVFITVDDDSAKFKGHLMHRDDPNKTWKSDGVWNGTQHSAGDPKPDFIGDYTDSEGVLHEYDGEITEAWCNGLSVPDDEPTPVMVDFFDPTCDADAGIMVEYNAEEADVKVDGEVAAGSTVTVTFTAKDGYVIEGEDTFTHTYGDVPSDEVCDPTEPPVDNPPKNDPPANNPPQNQPPTELPGTGAGDVLPWAGLGIALLLSGLLAYMVTSRRRSSI